MGFMDTQVTVAKEGSGWDPPTPMVIIILVMTSQHPGWGGRCKSMQFLKSSPF